MRKSFHCLFCGKLLTPVNASDEHIIPNAIGGQLRTKNATCAQCNSRAGYLQDAYLARQFGVLANALDVHRDRGRHPDAYLTDDITGMKYVLSQKKNPSLAPNLKVARDEKRLEFTFIAPTRREAERIRQRGASLTFWLKNRKTLWIERASFEGLKRYWQLKDQGVSDALASAEAQKEAQSVLLGYGLNDLAIELRITKIPLPAAIGW